MEVVYCESCGSRIQEVDITSGKAVKSGVDYFCPQCVEKLGIKPELPKPQARSKTPLPMRRQRGPTRTPSRGMQAAPPSRPRSARQQSPSARGARTPQAQSSTAVLAIVAGVIAFILTLVVILLLKK